MSDASEDIQLQEALAFIGDLGIEFDHAEIVDTEISSVFWDEVPDEPTWASPQQTCQRYQTAMGLHTHKWPGASDPRPVSFNRTRTRRREELLHLRGAVVDLEHRLVTLRADQTNRARTSRPHATEESREESKEIIVAWEQVAAGQYKQRRQSEMENIKLRRLLDEQIQLGKSIERLLLKKRPSIESLESSVPTPKRLRQLGTYPASHMSIFDELLVHCALQYAETDGVVARLNHTSLAMSFRGVRLVPTTSVGVTLESTDQHILPFSYGDTVDEIWSFTPAGSAVIRIQEFQDVDHTEDTAKFLLHVTVAVNHEHSEFDVKVAMRRYVEADRTVIVFAGMIEPGEISGMNMDGLRMRLTAWHIIEPVDRRGLSQSKATKIISHSVLAPDVEEGLCDRARKVSRFMDLLLRCVTVDFESRKQHLENCLLQRSVVAVA